MADTLDADSLRDTLNRVIAYRNLQKAVRSSGRGNFIWGAIFFGLWYITFGQGGVPQKFQIFGYIQITIACLEVGVGLLKQVWPSAECLLLDALIFATFAGSNLLRVALAMGAGGGPPIVPILFGLYMGYYALEQVRGYRRLRQLYPETPTAAHIRYVNDLLHEIRASDPEDDPAAVRFGKHLSGKLLGDLLIAADSSGGAFVVPREGAEVRKRTADPDDGDRLPDGRLFVYGEELARFPLTDATWRNYARWKGV